MTLCAARTKLLQRAGRERAERLLPAPFSLWYSSHDTGCQMTIVAKGMPVWCGSIWYNDIYQFNDRDKIAGLQPDFDFAREVIEQYFAAVEAEVAQAELARAEAQEARRLAAEAEKRAALDEIRQQVA